MLPFGLGKDISQNKFEQKIRKAITSQTTANARLLSREILKKIIYKTKPHSIIFDQG